VTARPISTRAPRSPEGLVLVLPGGASRKDRPAVSPAQLSVLRHRSVFEGAPTDFVRATLLGADITGPVADLLDCG
jgi:hypothetical protein